MWACKDADVAMGKMGNLRGSMCGAESADTWEMGFVRLWLQLIE